MGVKPYVLRYWETEFNILNPGKNQRNEQRMYTRTDVENALLIKHLLHDLKFSIQGAKKRISEMRRQGGLAEARKIKLAVDATKVEEIKKELQELIALCSA